MKGRVRTWCRYLPGYHALRMLWWWGKGGESRSLALLLLRRPRHLFQPYNTSTANRYPELFAFVRHQVADQPDSRLLSFGCARGEEIVSLRRLFGQAHIDGIDINRRNIAQARQRLAGDPSVRLHVAGDASVLPAASCDAVFALAVFRHGDLGGVKPAARCDRLIRFQDFEQVVTSLADSLRPGGLLCIRHANFLFSQTAVAQGFEPVLYQPACGSPVYGPDNLLMPSPAQVPVVFRKVPVQGG
ncbi:class I SAM-dependent methyltransferase [Insolitispirillum peregrinum]|uniref:Methyltransferase domain-containing protein n=1 Tax=Insolitispirillum peregrinum TaxID=80876 RepID=A0A1N7PBJ3_9PROT|nr:class I SAM-dependent methyltransferase [Insolitispirillum peregrinum]SIT07886.1 Methyltransferase domain-containing protein [Insolitispirillum peregrinum]